MLRRKIYDKLVEWKSNPHKPLIVKGQRQVGKTFIIDRFGRDNYGSYLRIDFSTENDLNIVFESYSDIDSLISRIELFHPEFQPVAGNTLLFFDEVQECPRARSSLKSFSIDGRYDVIASGSLLGVSDSRLGSYGEGGTPPLLPMGYEEHMTMYSMDFEEFLWARRFPLKPLENARKCLHESTPIDDVVCSRLAEEFRYFMTVGGMPEAVSAFIESGYQKTRKVLGDILSTCRNDINRYNSGADVVKTSRCFDSIPSQLAETNKRFTYSRVEPGTGSRASARKYESNLLWIGAAGYGNICYSLSQVKAPLESNVHPDLFRVYVSDTGMLVSMYSEDTAKAVILNDTAYNRGAVAENVIAECLVKSGFKPYYYRRSNGNDKMELDFVTMLGLELAVIEVKSGKHKEYASISKAVADRKLVFEDSNIFTDDRNMEHYPLFAAAFIEDLVRRKADFSGIGGYSDGGLRTDDRTKPGPRD